MHTTNYRETFITVAPDTNASAAKMPLKPGSVATRQFEMIMAAPYAHTSDDVIFSVYADRQDIPGPEREMARQAFFAKGQACLRSSPLVKTHGWGIHHDAEGRVALYGVETQDYAALAARKDLKIISGMRSKRT